jgi:hypothetical protein
MSRRANPERIATAQREATVRRLELGGMLRDRAVAAVAAWERAHDGPERDWEAAYRAIAAQRST